MKSCTPGQLIRAYREQEGLTQEELAEIIHVTKGKLSHWENDETIPRPTMVARLIGALRISDDGASLLMRAVEDATTRKSQEQAAIQAIIDEQNAEEERQEHKQKTLRFLSMGIAGFLIGCLISFLTGSYKDNPWYFTIVIGILMAGIPFGWSILTDKSEEQYEEPYYDPINRRSYLIIKLFCFVLKFIGAYLIGIATFPVILSYHAYKAGKKGSLYKKVMCVVFVLISLFVGVIAFFIVSAALPGA